MLEQKPIWHFIFDLYNSKEIKKSEYNNKDKEEQNDAR